ncbi:hypothetical protein GX441_12145 [bacterium]|nr:hypothetical protein [bacterium]
MVAGKLKFIRTLMFLFILTFLVSCPPQEPTKAEIQTYDILLDYDHENNTNIAQVYKNTMDRFYDWNPSKDEIAEITDTAGEFTLHIFGVRHQSRLAIIRFLRSVLPFIKKPGEWAFFVEGIAQDETSLPEVFFFKGVAQELNIKTFDPIVSPLGAEVTARLLLGTPPMVTLKDIHFAVINDLFPTPASLHSLSAKTRNSYVSMISSYSLFPRDSIERLLVEYDTAYLSRPLRLASAEKVFAQIRRDMVDTSNILSRALFADEISKLKNTKHIFICVGIYHLPVFENPDELLNQTYQIHMLPEEVPSTK